MRKLTLLMVALMATLVAQADVFCHTLLQGLNDKHSAYITCSALGNLQYQVVFESVDAFTGYNAEGSNFYANVNGVGGYQISNHMTQSGDSLVCVFTSSQVPTIYAPDFFVQYSDGEEHYVIPASTDFSQVCNYGGGGTTPQDTTGGQGGVTPTPLTTGDCTGSSTAVDAFYTNADPAAITSMTNGFNWSCSTTSTGVDIKVQMLDNLAGMATPLIFFFNKGVLIGDPILMAWDPTTKTASYTKVGVQNGDNLVFLVEFPHTDHVLFTERVMYTVGSTCGEEGADIVGQCTGTSKGVDAYYSKDNGAATQANELTNGYKWICTTKTNGDVDLEMDFLDYFEGMAAPQLFLFHQVDGNEQLDGDPIPMEWLGTKALYTLTGKQTGDDIRFLVQIAYTAHVLFSERVSYTVGQDCREQSALEDVEIKSGAMKFLRNGRLYIRVGNQIYDAQGKRF